MTQGKSLNAIREGRSLLHSSQSWAQNKCSVRLALLRQAGPAVSSKMQKQSPHPHSPEVTSRHCHSSTSVPQHHCLKTMMLALYRIVLEDSVSLPTRRLVITRWLATLLLGCHCTSVSGLQPLWPGALRKAVRGRTAWRVGALALGSGCM